MIGQKTARDGDSTIRITRLSDKRQRETNIIQRLERRDYRTRDNLVYNKTGCF